MHTRWLIVCLLCGALVGLAVGGAAQAGPEPVSPDVVRLVVALRAMSERIRVTLHLATLGVLSPTQADQRLYAGQVVNHLVGPGGVGFDPRLGPEEKFTGLLIEAHSLTEFLPQADVPPELKERLAVGLKKVLLLLTMARDDAVQAVRARRLDVGADLMLRAFAYLHAALGRETDPVYLGGLLSLLRILPPVPPPPAGGIP